eukprot:18341-Rhodomonas_salina.4
MASLLAPALIWTSASAAASALRKRRPRGWCDSDEGIAQSGGKARRWAAALHGCLALSRPRPLVLLVPVHAGSSGGVLDLAAGFAVAEATERDSHLHRLRPPAPLLPGTGEDELIRSLFVVEPAAPVLRLARSHTCRRSPLPSQASCGVARATA